MDTRNKNRDRTHSECLSQCPSYAPLASLGPDLVSHTLPLTFSLFFSATPHWNRAVSHSLYVHPVLHWAFANLLVTGRADRLLPRYLRLCLYCHPAVPYTRPSRALRPCTLVQQMFWPLAVLLSRVATSKYHGSNRSSDDGSNDGEGTTPNRCRRSCTGTGLVRYHGSLSVVEAGMPRICVRRCILALFVGELKYGDSRLSIILVNENVPTPDSLGATNGLVLFAMCLTRSFCPAFVRYGDNQG
jgi:hypothetical protein